MFINRNMSQDFRLYFYHGWVDNAMLSFGTPVDHFGRRRRKV